MTWRFSKRAAARVARRAARAGVPEEIAHDIAFACRKYRLRYALGFAMIEQESGFRNIYGHDVGGLFPGKRVTEANYRVFREQIVKTGGVGANGVGLSQITYWTYVRDHPGLWKPAVQVYLGISILADYVHRMGEIRGIGAYNGGEANPNPVYSAEVRSRARKWRPILAGLPR